VWAAKSADIISLCKFTPVHSREVEKMFKQFDYDMNDCLFLVSKNGWY
jgi:hypothetical protein